ncbi:MAG: potassium transporter Kup [Methylococcales bacterium]|nr:MAG: potassium transporter Kup [Methylococcales bacterium]
MSSHTQNQTKKQIATLAMGAIGVVFGDIGTSPLYALKEVFLSGLTIDKLHVFGALSLVFWTLTLVVTIKYAIFIMRADNKGEGGIMALTALALEGTKGEHGSARKISFIITLGLLGTVLFYGDSIITPAISVLSAIEGLQIVAPQLVEYIEPITIAVLGLLFVIQSKGSGKMGIMFAPIMCIWFTLLAVMGVINIVEMPEVLMAINPYYGVSLLIEYGWHSFFIMGAVVLAITGAEALYADMGHFGLKPIRYAWFGFVFPSLLLNYFGQGALLIQHPEAIENPFYLLAPTWALYPLLILAALATVIASQAVISGAFSMTRQAVQLGYCPRVTILHTSGQERGQVYVPAVNWLLMVAVFILVLSFKSSTALASAYGLAVTGTMLATTILSFIVIEALWQWNKYTSVAFLAIFLTVDTVFISSNSLKIPTGGWLPLVVGAVLFLILTTWIKGRALLSNYMDERKILFEDLEEKVSAKLAKVEGTAIYLTRSLHGVPQVLLHNLEHNHVLHERIIVLTIVTTNEPYVSEENLVKIRTFGKERNFYRIKLYYGFKQTADVRRALELCAKEGLEINPKNASFFIGSEQLSFRNKSPMPKWRRALFRFLFHNSTSAIEFFKIPVDRVVELGIRIEL